MSVPQRPRDIQLANIIDKLAEFVARNGQEFESLTRIKQRSNEKFAFLSQENQFYNYYQYRLLEEKRNLLEMPHQPQNALMQQLQQKIWSNNGSNNATSSQSIGNFSSQRIDTINAQKTKLREQIMQSEKNLSAQHQVLLQQQKSQIEDAITQAQTANIVKCAQENQIELNELENILQPIIDSCTKDSISYAHEEAYESMTNFEIKPVTYKIYISNSPFTKEFRAMSTGAAFTQKLHLIYLINDLLHYCVRKNADELKNSLESVVIPMFCNATISANEEEKDKLNKLLALWSSKANFFDSCAISKLQSPPSSLQEYQNTLLGKHASVITPLSQATKAKFDHYQQQHQAFVEHASKQIALLETEKQKLEQQNLNPQVLITELAQNAHQIIPSLMNAVNIMQPQNRTEIIQTLFNSQNFKNQQHNFSSQQHQDINNKFLNFNLPPPNFSIPDLSRPPPGFNSSAENSPPQIEITEAAVPQPFFTLPAGLIVPLIRLEDYSYHALESELIKFPPSTIPTEKLVSAVEAFYAAPSHERPRDTEGWEKLGLYEYFKMKNAARKQKEEAVLKGVRHKSKSPSPISESFTKLAKKQKKRFYRSKSPEIRSSKSKSRSVTPPAPRPIITPSTNKGRSRKRSRSPNTLSDQSPYRNFNSKDSRVDRRKRSVTPPSFIGATPKVNEFIDEGNKGHQMLKKLGWKKETGLGFKNQGIAEPISGGEIRDRNDLYKGVGCTNDPYENFRRNRSTNFIVRMKSRGEEKN